MPDLSEKMVTVELSLKEWFSGAKKVVVIGIGNHFSRDDNVGVINLRSLNNKVSKSIFLIEAETVPESFMQQIVEFNPTHILLIDAGLINKKPGTPQLVDPTQLIRKTSILTHTLPLRIFCDFITQSISVKIILLIIQPKDTSFGEGLTPELEQTANNLSNLLLRILLNTTKS